MFFTKKKTQRGKDPTHSRRSQTNMDFGLPGFSQNNDEDEDDLEAELFRLTGQKANQTSSELNTGDDEADLEAELEQIMGKSQMGRYVESLSKKSAPVANITFDDEADEDSNDDVDENDHDLLNELSMLTADEVNPTEEHDAESAVNNEEQEEKPVNQADLIRLRLEAYQSAEANAKKTNESSRARRFNRGVKTLEKQLKRALAGDLVPYDEIPPEIATNLKPAAAYDLPTKNANNDEGALPVQDRAADSSQDLPTVLPSPSATSPEENHSPNLLIPIPLSDSLSSESVKEELAPDNALLSKLDKVRAEYKAAALNAKKLGDLATALTFVKTVKLCDKLIEDLKNGKVIDELNIPTPPNLANTTRESKPRKTTEKTQGMSARSQLILGEMFTIPTTVMDALEQRLAYYNKAFQKAEATNRRIDARRYNDIIRVYQNSIALHKKGARVPYEKLPNPPGCPPIPLSF